MGRRASDWLACFFVAALLAPGFNAFETPDANIARAFADTGRLSIEALPGDGAYVRAPNGRYYTEHEAGSDVVAAPVALVAASVARTGGVPFAQVFGFLMCFVAAGFFATTVVLLSGAGCFLGVPERYTVGALIVLTLGSQYLIYAGSPPDVSLAAPLFAACFLAWMQAERGARWCWLIAGLCAGLLLAVKLSNATVIPVLLLLAVTSGGPEGPPYVLTSYVGRAFRPGPLIRVVAGVLPGLAIVFGWNHLRMGHWIGSPYPSGLYTFHVSALPSGLLGTLLSPGKGLLVFTPALLLALLAFTRTGIARRHARVALFIFGSLALTMLRFAGTAPWGSAGGWGIRYYVPWLPLMLWLVAADAWMNRTSARRVGMGVLIAAGMVINLSAVVTNFHYRQQICGYDGWSMRSANVCAVEALPANLARIAGANVPDVVVPGASPANVFVSNRLTVWWYAIRYEGVSPAVSWAIGVSLLLAAAVFWRFGRSLESPS